MGLPELYKSWREYFDRLLEQVRVLVVEDEPVVADVVKTLLEQENFQVDTVTTAEGGWARMESVRYDLIVTDKNLPGMSGVDLLKRMRKTDNKTPAVLITGYASIESLSEAMRQGAADYITKPFDDITHVLERLKRVIDRRFSSLQYYLIIQELKSMVASEELPEEVSAEIKGALFGYKTGLAGRLDTLILSEPTELVDAIQRTLNANRTNTEIADNAQTVIDRIESPSGPLVLLMELGHCEAELLFKIKNLDPLIEVIAFSTGSPPLERAVGAVIEGADDFALLGEEGLAVVVARVKRAADRARRRRLHVHLVSTLFRVGDITQEDADQLVALLPAADQRMIRRETRNEKSEQVSAPMEVSIDDLLSDPTSTDQVERRKAPRHPWASGVNVVYVSTVEPTETASVTARAHNISRTGMFIEANPIPIGTLITVFVVDEGGSRSVIPARVVRHASSSEPPGFGVEFLRPEEWIEATIDSLDSD